MGWVPVPGGWLQGMYLAQVRLAAEVATAAFGRSVLPGFCRMYLQAGFPVWAQSCALMVAWPVFAGGI